jgi:D-3-phosphoglycerate dehydrogenase / 2-oxoglutarate reductase
MRPIIFVALSTFSEFDNTPIDILKQSGFEYSVNSTGKRLSQKDIIGLARKAHGIIAGVEPYDCDVLECLQNIRCISRCGVGIDNIDLEKAKSKGIKILNTPDAVIYPVAELTIAMTFDLLKKLSYHTKLLKDKVWKKSAGSMLYGKKVGVLGLGRIGRCVAQLFVKLDAKVYGTDLHPDNSWAKAHQVTVTSVEDILRECDILTIHLASDEENPFCLDREKFSMMKKGVLVINTARGKFIDEEALYDNLRSGHLSGAALDVYSQEPYDGPLCGLENVVLTPHIATLTRESRTQMEIEAVNNIINFFESK